MPMTQQEWEEYVKTIKPPLDPNLTMCFVYIHADGTKTYNWEKVSPELDREEEDE